MALPQLSVVHGESLSSQISIDENALFLSDMQSLFGKERFAHVGSWQYSDSESANDPVKGAFLWENFLKATKNYYPLSGGIELIKDKSGLLIGNRTEPTWIADFGCGSEKATTGKVIPVKRHFKNVTGYSPIDKSHTFLVEASTAIEQDQSGIPIKAFQADYAQDEIQLPNGKNFGIFFGSTISNIEGRPEDGMPIDEIISLMTKLKSVLGDDGELLMDYDANQDEQSILASYMHDLQIEFGRNIMQRVKRDLPVFGDFDANAWRYEPVWHEKTHQLCHTIVSERDMDFYLGDERFKIKAGEKFILNNSFKYPVEKMKEWCQEAGWNTQSHVMDNQNRMALQLMAA